MADLTSPPRLPLFGTDGIRDLAGRGRLSDETVARVGRALARFTLDRTEGSGTARVLLGRDPRPSGASIVARLAGQLAAEGLEVVDAGMLPSPALAWATAAEGFALGIAVSASHNDAAWNGIKPFLGDARKLDRAQEAAIEAEAARLAPRPPRDRLREDPGPAARYVARTAEALAAGGPIADGLLVGDLSAGAAGRTAPAILEALGLTVRWLHAPGSRPINSDCGSEHPAAWARAVQDARGQGGLAFDGDADRVVLADETGALLDGDDLLALLATAAARAGGVPAGAVVSTVMANLGLEEHLATLGVRLLRTPVGDRHVAARMRETGAALGGEPAGHLVLPRADAGPAPILVGDGLVAGVHALQAARALGLPLSAARALRPRRPQILVNVPMARRVPLETWAALQDEMARRERDFEGAGRLVVRYSGTEPLLRIMAEGRDADRVAEAAEALAAVARARA